MSEAEHETAHFLEIFQTRTQELAFCEGSNQYQWGDMLQRIEEWTVSLISSGVNHLDTILLSLPPSVDLFTYLFAIQHIGAKAVVLPPSTSRGDLMRWIDATKISTSILTPQVIQRINTDITQRPHHLRGFVHDAPALEGWPNFQQLPRTASFPSSHQHSFSLLSLSTGTYAPPHMLQFTSQQLATAYKAFANRIKEHIDTPHVTQHLPWSFTMWTTSLGTLLAGGSITLPHPSSPYRPVAITSEHNPISSKGELEHIVTVGRPLSTWNADDTPKKHNIFAIEAACGPITWASHPQQGLGIPLEGYELKLRRQRPVKPNQPGDILLHTPTLAQHVLDAEGRPTQLSMEEESLETQDIGRYDNKKHIHFLGRKERFFGKDRKRFEANTVEQQVRRHPQILDATLYEKPTPPKVLKLCIVVDEEASGRPLNTQRVLEYLRQHFPHYMLPKYIEFRHEIPKNAYRRTAYWKLP